MSLIHSCLILCKASACGVFNVCYKLPKSYFAIVLRPPRGFATASSLSVNSDRFTAESSLPHGVQPGWKLSVCLNSGPED